MFPGMGLAVGKSDLVWIRGGPDSLTHVYFSKGWIHLFGGKMTHKIFQEITPPYIRHQGLRSLKFEKLYDILTSLNEWIVLRDRAYPLIWLPQPHPLHMLF